MNQDRNSSQAIAIAQALGWNADMLTELLGNEALQTEVLEFCTIGSDLKEIAPTSDGFEARVLAALGDQGMVVESSAPLVWQRPSFGQVLGVAGASVAAVLTTVFALMSTGSLSGGNPALVLGASLVAGAVVARAELTDLAQS